MFLNILLIITVVINLIFGLFTLSKSKQELSRVFTLMALCFVFWTVIIILLLNATVNSDVTLLYRLAFIAPIINGYLFLFFVKYYLNINKLKDNDAFIRVFYTIFMVLLLCSVFSSFIIESAFKVGILNYSVKRNFGNSLVAIYLCFVYLYGIIIFTVNYYKYFLRGKKYDLIILIFGTLITFIGIYSSSIIGPLFFKFNNSSFLSPVWNLFFITAMFYAVLKYNLLDIQIVLKKTTSIIITLLFILVTLVVTLIYTKSYGIIIQFMVLGVFTTLWTFYGKLFQEFLITTARQAFVKGWFDTDKLFKDLSNKLTGETNRLKIFKTIESVFDEHINFERTAIVMAIRAEDNSLNGYQYIVKENPTSNMIDLNSPLIKEFILGTRLKLFSEINLEAQAQLKELNISSKSLFLPINSPELLEGVIVLDERSCEAIFNQSELDIFNTIINYVSAILYKLTPYEKIEKNFLANQKRLHDAEIQILRSKKNESIGHLHRQFSHELRTPLNCIMHIVESLDTKPEDEPKKQDIFEEINNALSIVQETLRLSKTEELEERIETMIDINEAIRVCLKLIPASGYVVKQDLSLLPKTFGVYRDIQMVFTNIMANAREAMPNGGTVTIKSYVEAGDIYIKFSDTGRGIPEDMKAKVWQPYISGNQTEYGNDTGGRGWGLTIVNRIIEEHQGFISFETEVGKGTTFTIRLPIRTE